jgi:hypothetical protein
MCVWAAPCFRIDHEQFGRRNRPGDTQNFPEKAGFWLFAWPVGLISYLSLTTGAAISSKQPARPCKVHLKLNFPHTKFWKLILPHIFVKTEKWIGNNDGTTMFMVRLPSQWILGTPMQKRKRTSRETVTRLWRSVHVWKLRRGILFPNMVGRIAYVLMLQFRRDYNCSLWYVILLFSFFYNRDFVGLCTSLLCRGRV